MGRHIAETAAPARQSHSLKRRHYARQPRRSSCHLYPFPREDFLTRRRGSIAETADVGAVKTASEYTSGTAYMGILRATIAGESTSEFSTQRPANGSAKR